MRPIEKRIAAIEAKAPTVGGNIRVFFQPIGADRQAFRRQCEIEAPGAHCLIVVFVKPGDAQPNQLH